MRSSHLFRPAVLILAVVLAAGLTSSAFAAAETGYDFSNGLQTAVIQYVDAHPNLTPGNFAMGYYNTVTGEQMFYNPDKFIVGGSVYKIPLCMVYEDLLTTGLRQRADKVVNEQSYTIERAMELSLVYSYQDAADALENALRRSENLDYIGYRNLLASYSGLDPSTFDESYYHTNTFSPRCMIGTLQTLYNNASRYGELIDWMKQANPGHYFRLYDSAYEIAQKYGQYNHCTATAGIIYTPQPILLAVFIDGYYLEEVTADIAAMAIAYAASGAAPTVPPPSSTVSPSSPSVPYRSLTVAGGVTVELDGEKLEPKDANGQIVDVFTYEGTTYLPVRALSEALGFDIAWDGESRTVRISAPEDAESPAP